MTHLLVVANQADTRTLRAVLERAGYQAIVAADGQAAQALARLNTEPLVVLLDEGAPPLSGNDLLAQCQLLGAAPAPRGFLLLAAPPAGNTLSIVSIQAITRPLPVSDPVDVARVVVGHVE